MVSHPSVLPVRSGIERGRREEGPAAVIAGRAGAPADHQRDEEEDVAADRQQLDPSALLRRSCQQRERPATDAQVRYTQRAVVRWWRLSLCFY